MLEQNSAKHEQNSANDLMFLKCFDFFLFSKEFCRRYNNKQNSAYEPPSLPASLHPQSLPAFTLSLPASPSIHLEPPSNLLELHSEYHGCFTVSQKPGLIPRMFHSFTVSQKPVLIPRMFRSFT